ncbi:MAG: hypothetical protein J7F05_06195 [Trichodesmium erythraeum GBRTRLIN201]|nr:hypothetical protein [Trichodesmium erythraeum GBRTRLIN201]
MMNKIFFALVISVLLNSCLSTKGPNSPISIGKNNRIVNIPTEYYDNSSKVTVIYDGKNIAYIPKFELSTYEQNFIDQSIEYHNEQYDISKSELRNLEQQSIDLEEELENGNISNERYNQRVRELGEEKANRRIEKEKYKEGSRHWSGQETQGNTISVPRMFHKIRIAAEENIENICGYSDDYEYPNTEFQKIGNAKMVSIHQYSSQEITYY